MSQLTFDWFGLHGTASGNVAVVALTTIAIVALLGYAWRKSR